MNGKKVLTSVMPIVEKIVLELNYELIDVEYRKDYSGMVMEVIIYKDGGITLEDCEKVSKALDEPLDKLDPTDGLAYTLNVSSPGLDRPLKKLTDFKRNLNNEIFIKFFAPFDGKKEIIGTLISYNEKSFTITKDNEQIEIEINKAAHIVPVIKF